MIEANAPVAPTPDDEPTWTGKQATTALDAGWNLFADEKFN